MAKTSIKGLASITNSAVEFVQWPSISTTSEKLNIKQNLINKVLAIQTTRIAPDALFSDSNQAYQAFNLGLHVGDCVKKVEENRQYLSELLPDNTSIQWLEQVHGNDVVEICQTSAHAITADAAITRNKNTCLAIMTADCLPILLASQHGDEIAAIHGGWRPLAANIIDNTLVKMKTKNSDLVAWLGPCISKGAFEVGSEVKEVFIEKNKCFNSAFTSKSNGKYMADLHQIALIQLERLGITQISTLPECTYSNSNKYYSYRKNPITGRMATLICLL